ncbi:MAG: hypothetical protein L3K07_04395 [Thermoplasmata archaeon]|nr:hypothetical protein [Thermoplasmata archaeon]
MPLIAPDHQLTPERLLEIGAGLLAELRELREELEVRREMGPAAVSRLWTIRGLLEDTERLASARTLAELDPEERALVANLLYDVTLVGAEYYKMFIARPGEPYPTPPIRVPRP